MTHTASYQSPFGPITLASDGNALIGLWFEGQRHYGSTLGDGLLRTTDDVILKTCRWLDSYFSGRCPTFTPPLKLEATPFRQCIYRLLLQVPYGTTASYGEIAHRYAQQYGKSLPAYQAVGSAIGRNPISVIVPCHRIIGSHGRLGGYAGGLEIKQQLLQLENINTHII